MFFALKKEKPVHREAAALYEAAMSASRREEFYTDLAVPDTMDGRYDLLLVHIFLILHRLRDGNDPALPQALFDICFTDIDQALRESGVGDMKIAKHMKKMMLAFNGRMHAYEEALEQKKPEALAESLKRNLYATTGPVKDNVIEFVAEYIHANVKFLKAQALEEINLGKIQFKAPEKGS